MGMTVDALAFWEAGARLMQADMKLRPILLLIFCFAVFIGFVVCLTYELLRVANITVLFEHHSQSEDSIRSASIQNCGEGSFELRQELSHFLQYMCMNPAGVEIFGTMINFTFVGQIAVPLLTTLASALPTLLQFLGNEESIVDC